MADQKIIFADDLGKAQSIDYVSRFNQQVSNLAEVLNITRRLPLERESVLRLYKWKKVQLAEQVGEGEVIPLTKVEREMTEQKTAPLRKYRKQVTEEAINRVGLQLAINETDTRIITEVQQEIKADFFKFLVSKPEKIDASNLQEGIAQAWAKIRDIYKSYGAVNVLHFVSPFDIADMLAAGTVTNTSASAFGLTALENFLGQRVIVFDEVPKGKIYSTVAENILLAHYNMSGDLGRSFNLTTDTTGLVGMTHQINTSNASVETFITTGVTLFAEISNGVVVTTLTKQNPEPTPNPNQKD